jgi:hypothetical protein
MPIPGIASVPAWSTQCNEIYHAGNNEVIMEQSGGKAMYGDSIRSRYRSKAGDFVMFADDDNYYKPDALQTVRSVVQHDFDALYVFQMWDMGYKRLIPDLDQYGGLPVPGNVDTGDLKSVALNDGHILTKSVCGPASAF